MPSTIAEKKKRIKEIDALIAEEEKKLQALSKDDKVELAKSIMEKMFSEFKKASNWLNWTKKHAEENYYTYSPVGFRRNLFGIMTGINAIVSAMGRRAANSPVQGLASQIGITAARLLVLELHKVLMKFGYMDENTREMPAEILKAVHDANYSEVPYEIVLIFIHILQWVATYGVTEYYEREFGFKFTVEPEIEIEVGASEDAHYKWNWLDGNLKEHLKKTLEDQVKLKTLKEDPEKVLKKIYSVYENKKLKAYLEKHYPILGVRT